jgi:hypothetical protein
MRHVGLHLIESRPPSFHCPNPPDFMHGHSEMRRHLARNLHGKPAKITLSIAILVGVNVPNELGLADTKRWLQCMKGLGNEGR